MATTDQRFTPTTGTFTGWLGLVVVAAVIIVCALTERSLLGLRVALGALVVGTLIYCYLLRPRVLIGPRLLVLRNALADTSIPLALITEVSVRSVTAVFAGDARYVGIAVGHPVRRLMREQVGRGSRRLGGLGSVGGLGSPGNTPDTALSGSLLNDKVPDFVERQIMQAVQNAQLGARGTGDQVVRRPAYLELAVLAALVVLFVVALFL